MINILDSFTKALELDDMWKVTNINFTEEEKKFEIFVSHKKGKKYKCPECGELCNIHDTVERTWRDADILLYASYIHCKVPRIKCNKHKVKTVETPWARKHVGYTYRIEQTVITLAYCMTMNQIAKFLNIHDKTIANIIKRYVERKRMNLDLSHVKRIGIDETSSKRGHNYITIFFDLDTKKIIYITEGKDNTTIDRFALFLEEHKGKRSNITDITSDLAPAFKKGIENNFKHADVIYDKFHVIKLMNEAMDEVRRKEVVERPELKGARYSVLKNEVNLTKKQKIKLDELNLSKTNLKTGRAYRIKLMLQEVYQQKDSIDAAKLLQKWYSWAIRSKLEPVKKVAKTIVKHFAGIVKYTEKRISTGIVEGLNSMIQLAKRKARGFRNVQTMIMMSYFLYGLPDEVR